MPGKKFKQRKTDVIENGIVYRLYKDTRSVYENSYYVYTYTEDLPEKVVVADRIEGLPVTFLDTKSFQRSLCREVILPDSVLTIGSEAFSGCRNLETIHIPSGIKTVISDAFEKCKKLNHTPYCYGRYLGNAENPFLILHTNERVKKASEDEELVVEVHPETKFILSSTFNSWSCDSEPYDKIDKLILHDKLEYVSTAAFSMGFYGFDYAKIKTICVDNMECLCRACSEIPGAAQTLIVGGEVLGDTITIPASITKITSQCFYMFNSMKTLRFEGNISEICSEAFSQCKNLKEIYFPKKVGRIGCEAFYRCPSLEKVEFFEVEKIETQAFELEIYYPGAKIVPSKNGLREVVFRDRVGAIGHRAFGDNAMLERVIGIENVEYIEEDAFAGTPFENKTE